MVGSRNTDTGGRISGVAEDASGAALLDDICLDRRYVDGGRTLAKDEQQLNDLLEALVDGEIIPRLMLLHKKSAGNAPETVSDPPSVDFGQHIEAFSKLVLWHEVDIVAAYVTALRHQGVDLETLLLKLFAPTARRLGEMWEADEIDFVDVTVGTSRLQQLLHRFSHALPMDAHGPARRVLLLPTPSEQHTFGLLMVSDFFRRAGWEVLGGTPVGRDALPSMVADQWFALIGFSLSCERLISELGSTIKMVRRFSRNPAVKIMVGGRVFAQNETLKGASGADLVVADALEAVALAETVLQTGFGQRD